MFRLVGRVAVHRPWLVIAVWLIAAAGLTLWAPDHTPSASAFAFVPSHSESARADRLHQRVFPAQRRPMAIVVFRRADGGRLTRTDLRDVATVTGHLRDRKRPGVATVEGGPHSVSPNGKVALAHVFPVAGDPPGGQLRASVRAMREDTAELLRGSEVRAGMTGSVPGDLDSRDSSSERDALVMKATLVLVVVSLLVVFRSPLIALLPVAVIAVAYAVAVGLIAVMSAVTGMEADVFVSAILIIVLFGIGTDYVLFLLFRYREELRSGKPSRTALVDAVARVGETIASAASVVIVAFLALLLATVGTLRSMGPPLALAVAVTLVAALTLVPAVFSVLGTTVFWPSRTWSHRRPDRSAQRVGRLVSFRPALLTGVCTALLTVMALNASGFTANFATTALPDTIEYMRALKDMERGFSAGQSDPVQVYLTAEGRSRPSAAILAAYRNRLAGIRGVGAVSTPLPSPDGRIALYEVSLVHRPLERAAVELAGGPLRAGAHRYAPRGTTVLVGGRSAELADMRTAVAHDYKVVFPVAALAITVILALLLRSLVTPLYLMLSVALGFVAALGTVVWFYQDVQGQPGLSLVLPAVLYLFVVTLGTDYNILMVTRLREEMANGVPPRQAVRAAVTRSVPTIAAAALILAGTFGVLMLTGSLLLEQMGMALATGILITAFALATLLVPATMILLGRWAWWPAGTRPAVQDSGDGSQPA
ncbi:MMPL family transporter [Streptomyces caatingaensis]|uniref:Membrane protein n=1 Tax=Streptomyces caatingaensis TaxID=1678637 RepID=A0A0K9XM17_9ACTN|nr:MMPL family transporter [Streptomyces caatingaensis]KNB54146.1 membrane protein [Streptomyces caatingaensis]